MTLPRALESRQQQLLARMLVLLSENEIHLHLLTWSKEGAQPAKQWPLAVGWAAEALLLAFSPVTLSLLNRH